jgi:hypothetical protein
MTRFKACAVILAVGVMATAIRIIAAPVPQAPAQPPPPTGQPAQTGPGPFRAGVELVSLNVTVTDATTRYITDLQTDDFSVFEDGVKRDVTFFSRTHLPIALSLLLDTSASMESAAQRAGSGISRAGSGARPRRGRRFQSRGRLQNLRTAPPTSRCDSQDLGRRIDFCKRRLSR